MTAIAPNKDLPGVFADDVEVSPAAELTRQVENAKAAIAAADAKHSAALQEAERQRGLAWHEPKQLLDQLRAKYRDRAEELAQEDGSCPRSHWGEYLAADNVTVGATGIWLSWDINGDYAPATFQATWDALLAETAVEESAS